MSHTNFEWKPTPFIRVIDWFQLKEHLYTFELPPKRDPPPIEFIFTGQVVNILAMSSFKFHPNPTSSVQVINRFQPKEHLYTFELPPKRNPPPIELIFTGQDRNTLAMHPTKFHQNPSPFTQVTHVFMFTPKTWIFWPPPIELIFTG